jgi:hypothetical protein
LIPTLTSISLYPALCLSPPCLALSYPVPACPTLYHPCPIPAHGLCSRTLLTDFARTFLDRLRLSNSAILPASSAPRTPLAFPVPSHRTPLSECLHEATHSGHSGNPYPQLLPFLDGSGKEPDPVVTAGVFRSAHRLSHAAVPTCARRVVPFSVSLERERHLRRSLGLNLYDVLGTPRVYNPFTGVQRCV